MTGVVVRPARSQGMLSLEAAFGLALLVLICVTLLGFGRQLLVQVRLEDEASGLARVAARVPAPAGAKWRGSLAARSERAFVSWGEELVWVRVEAARGTAAAERALPRQAPWKRGPK